MRSVDIRDLRKAAYVGEASGNWLEARNKLFCAGIHPRHWNDEAVILDGQTLTVGWFVFRSRPNAFGSTLTLFAFAVALVAE
jgi:hypothetical protein